MTAAANKPANNSLDSAGSIHCEIIGFKATQAKPIRMAPSTNAFSTRCGPRTKKGSGGRQNPTALTPVVSYVSDYKVKGCRDYRATGKDAAE